MTKPQRYTFLSPYSIDTTCLEFDIDHMPDNSDDIIVKYDDHMAEVEQLQARIDELEGALNSVSDKDVDLLLEKVGVTLNQIKAEGIEEMLKHLKEVDDGDTNFIWFIADKYLNKLREGDDGE